MSSEEVKIQNASKSAVGTINEFDGDQLLDVNVAQDSLKQKIILSFEALDLPNLDKGSKSDPILLLFEVNNQG